MEDISHVKTNIQLELDFYPIKQCYNLRGETKAVQIYQLEGLHIPKLNNYIETQ